MSCQEVLRTLPAVPPSVQSVLCALVERQPRTGAELREATGLPRRTVYAALQRLKRMGLLHERLSLKDSRQSYFWLDPSALGAAQPGLAAAA